MLHISDVLSESNVLINVKTTSKKQLLDIISTQIVHTHPTLNKDSILDAFIKREHLGSTALGHGVAIPHIRMTTSQLPSTGVFIQLAEAIEFDSQDNIPVDLIFALLVTTGEPNEHLHLLSEISNQLISNDIRERLRNALTPSSIIKLLVSHDVKEIA